MSNGKETQLKHKTIAFDLDGVLAQYSGWKGKDHFGKPVPGMRSLLLKLKADGWKIIIFTARGAHETQLWADEHDIPYDWININGDFIGQNMGKPIADIYVDDRAICFRGDPYDLLKQIDEFQPWRNKGDKEHGNL